MTGIADQEFGGNTTQRETAARAEAYSAYLARIHPQLPADFQRLLASVCIHDAALRELTVDWQVGGLRALVTRSSIQI